ncbi:MAG: hypothetical protein Q8O37_05455 [Sulfuricellaceae bacterium]|nr:hypothetical protein [Sulfuricellaceae bacterium]
MSSAALFCSLSSQSIADLIRPARQAVCYAELGIQSDLAQAVVETGKLAQRAHAKARTA